MPAIFGLDKPRVRPPEFGDIVVMKVARHDNIGRETADGTSNVAIAVKRWRQPKPVIERSGRTQARNGGLH